SQTPRPLAPRLQSHRPEGRASGAGWDEAITERTARTFAIPSPAIKRPRVGTIRRMPRRDARLCAYCPEPATEREHAMTRALYPKSLAKSRVQRIVVPACDACN